MGWSPQARAAALAARQNKRKGTPVSRAKAALPTQRTNKQRNMLLGLHPGATAKQRRMVRTVKSAGNRGVSNAGLQNVHAKATTRANRPVTGARQQSSGGFTNKPQHQPSITGMGNAAHGVTKPHAQAPKVLPPPMTTTMGPKAQAYRKQGAKLGVPKGGSTARDVRRLSNYNSAGKPLPGKAGKRKIGGGRY